MISNITLGGNLSRLVLPVKVLPRFLELLVLASLGKSWHVLAGLASLGW